MGLEDEIIKNIEALRRFRPGHPLKHYIHYIVFPRYKNLQPGTRIEFEFPVAALVGANGIGKTSVLHALWGAPYGYSTSRFWFETDLDPIEGEGSDTQRFFYGHWNESFNGCVETRKNRVRRKDRSKEYWEPARIRLPDGMQPLPDKAFEGKTKDRWNPVHRDVVYINLKSVFGGFDRYFYFSDDDDPKDRSRIRRASAKLREVKAAGSQSFKYYGKERIVENRPISDEELRWVSSILGRAYEAAHIVQHSFYPGVRGHDFTVIFKRGAEYSEAFAGSGELSVVKLVVEVLAAKRYSLVLLDEPETSLHPGAQRQLLYFLLEQVKRKKLQVVLSTHSPDLIQGLPKEAIHAFDDFGEGKTRVLGGVSPIVAFNRLGKMVLNVVRVLVEDELAKLLVERAMDELDEGERNAIDVRVAPGGACAMLAQVGPAAMVSGDNLHLMLDGDQKMGDSLPKRKDLSLGVAEEPEEMDALFVEHIGVKPALNISGGDEGAHKTSKLRAQLEYLEWLSCRLHFLPMRTPEEVVLRSCGEAVQESSEISEIKDQFKRFLSNGDDVNLSSEEIRTLAKVKIRGIASDVDWMDSLIGDLRGIIS